MHQYDQFRGGPGEGTPERPPVEVKLVAVPTHAHFDCERILGLGQVVAKHAVQRSEKRLTLRPGHTFTEEWSEARECMVEASANKLGDATDALVGNPGKRTRRTCQRFAQNGWTLGNCTVHRLDQCRHTDGRLDGKL